MVNWGGGGFRCEMHIETPLITPEKSRPKSLFNFLVLHLKWNTSLLMVQRWRDCSIHPRVSLVLSSQGHSSPTEQKHSLQDVPTPKKISLYLPSIIFPPFTKTIPHKTPSQQCITRQHPTQHEDDQMKSKKRTRKTTLPICYSQQWMGIRLNDGYTGHLFKVVKSNTQRSTKGYVKVQVRVRCKSSKSEPIFLVSFPTNAAPIKWILP